jgi:hypothetical protein
MELKEADIERQAHDTSYLDNSVVKSLAWSDVSVTVRDRETQKPKKILGDVSGHVAAGENSLELNSEVVSLSNIAQVK